MTPKFLNLAKSINCDSLSVVSNENGIPFQNSRDRSQHITEFYRSLYSFTEGAPRNFQGCVAEFLVPDIVNNPITQGMILGAEERERLDMPFTLELDKALDKANMSSASGIDRVSNKMIKKIWH